jgi:hypothetical protein
MITGSKGLSVMEASVAWLIDVFCMCFKTILFF